MQTEMERKNQNNNKRRTPPWIVGALVLLSLFVLVILQSSNVWKNFSVETANDTLLLYGLSSLNFIAFVIFAFILLRSLVKLSRERKTFQLGAKIKTRLLIYFIALSILPIVAMAGFSYLFLNRAVDRWMSQIPEKVVREAKEVQNLRQAEIAKMLVGLLENQEITNNLLTQTAENGNMYFVEVLSVQNEVIAFSERNLSSEIRKAIKEKLNESEVFSANFADGRRLVIIPDLNPENSFTQTTKDSLADFDRLKSEQLIIRQMGLSTLGLLTFLLIFASTWTAFYVARGLTTPIKALAEGSDEIAQGNFSYRVNVLAEDELELLVKAFNQMSQTLESNSVELKERQKYIETVLESLSTGVISFDSEDKVLTINKSAVEMLKLEKASFRGFSLKGLVGEENRSILEKLIGRAKRIGIATEQTVLMREYADGSTQTGENLPVALTATALPDKKGVVIVIEDLTELIQAQRASAWQEVARRMAHEIKNPLTPIQLSAERIAKKFAQNSNDETNLKVVNEGTETILREVTSLKTMVDEFSKFARLPKVKPEKANLNDLIEQIINLYQDRNIKIVSDLAGNLPNTLIDKEQLKRVFVNLIENSIEAFEKSQNDKHIHIKTWQNSARDLIIAEFSDNGQGIPQSDFQKLFQPYFSTKGRGTGLGLAIVQRIVAEHSGKIKAVPNSPKGARFIVELPITS